MNLLSEENSPFPLDSNRYNKLIKSDDLTVYIPYKSEQPFVFLDLENDRTCFLYATNLERISFEIFYCFENFDDIDTLIDIANFSVLESKINMVIINKTTSETFYYKKNKSVNKMLRCYKSQIVDDKHIPFWVLELENHNKYMPIEKRSVNGKTIESYFHLDILDNKIYHSYSLSDDKPFQVIKYYIDDDFFCERDYLIPSIKDKRTLVYKPTYIKTKNNKLVDFEYIINGIDYTNKAKSLLVKLNIEDPSKHNFTEKEKEYFTKELTN